MLMHGGLLFKFDRMVDQVGPSNPLSNGHLPGAIKLEPYFIHHTIVVYIGRALCSILWELVKVTVFSLQPIVHQNSTIFGMSQKKA